MGDVEELIGRLREGVTQVGLGEDNCTELFDVTDADEVMSEAADALTALQARLAAVEAERDAARDKALEEAAAVADGFHERALEWAKTVRGLTEHIDETDSSRIASAIRAIKGTDHG